VKAEITPYVLKFKFEAGTSRGVLTEKKTWFITVYENSLKGIGECGPLKGLSTDDRIDFEDKLFDICNKLHQYSMPATEAECLDLAGNIVPDELPSVRFGVETALLDLLNGGKKIIFDNAFSKGNQSIPINGLIWMGKKDFMLEQIKHKLKEGYSCLKMKIGAINFQQECELLEFIRNQFSESELALRVDANGAFTFEEAKEKLKILRQYGIHSIEQPIKAKQLKEMAELVKLNLLPIALDEELIGIHTTEQKVELLEIINPPYIILKPTLVGGIRSCREWINLAEERNIAWWITSALESNTGLNAIAQFTAEYDIKIPQGLGTGQLYRNNVESGLTIKRGALYCKIG